MSSYKTSVEIKAPVSQIWAATCDIDSWPDWTPTVTEVVREDAGPVRPGSAARIRQPKLRPATWTVLEAQPDKSFIWQTKATGYKITASHRFERSGDSTVMTLDAVMTGALAPLLWALSGRTVRRYLDQEAAGLKSYCERSH